MLKPNQKREVTRITEYVISGGAYFWSGYLMFFVMDKGLHLSLWWAKLLANVTGWLVNYALQRYWVFKNPALARHRTEVTGRYVVITLVDFLLDYMIVASLKQLGLTPYLGQFVSSGFFTVWNYLWYKYWVFPEKFAKRKRKPARVSIARAAAHRAHGHSAYQTMR
ncbi:GtrA family protein [Candidatus Saccharibacteria bacterium]|nr:GtrA family protein [Candidatus Saccharibacteria bacterium]